MDAIPELHADHPGPDGAPAPFDRSLIYAYAFRHSYAQRHADAGVGVEILQQLMDHRSMTVTQGYYTVSLLRKREAIKIMSGYVADRHGAGVPGPATPGAYELRSVAVGNCIEPANVRARGRGLPQTPPSPYNPTDAVYAAVRFLCTNGAGEPATLRQAIWNYNHSDDYVEGVLAIAASYAGPPSGAAGVAGTALRFALAQLGTPYRWGGEGDGGFDCSGLVQAAYASAGITMARTAQAQHDAGPQLAWGAEPEPGDLVFFGSDTDHVTHVGLYLGDGQMIDAPHAGAVVRVEPYRWGSYLGATRPALSAPRPIPAS